MQSHFKSRIFLLFRGLCQLACALCFSLLLVSPEKVPTLLCGFYLGINFNSFWRKLLFKEFRKEALMCGCLGPSASVKIVTPLLPCGLLSPEHTLNAAVFTHFTALSKVKMHIHLFLPSQKNIQIL